MIIKQCLVIPLNYFSDKKSLAKNTGLVITLSHGKVLLIYWYESLWTPNTG